MARAATKGAEDREALFSEALLSSLPDGVITYGPDGRCRSANLAATKLLGIPRERLLGQNFYDIESWKNSGLLRRAEETMRTGVCKQWDAFFTSTAGKTLWLHFRLERVDLAGEPTLLLLFADISERKALEESLELAQFSIDAAVDFVHWLGPDGRLLRVNQSSCRRYGYPREEMLGLTIFDLDPYLSLAGWRESWRSLKEGRAYTCEKLHRTKTGELFPVEVTRNYLRHGGKEYEVSVARDISARRQLERALRLTQLSVDGAADLIHWIGPEGRLLYVSDSMCRRHGYSREELVQMTVFDLDQTETPETWKTRWRDATTTSALVFETVHRTKAGELFPLELVSSYVKTEDGEYIFAFGRDITARRRAEEAALESERRYRTLVENAHDPIFVLDAEGRFTGLNPAVEHVTGYGREELLGQSLSTLARDLGEPQGEGEVRTRKLRVRTKDGRGVVLDANIRARKEGEATAYEYIARDVTEENLWEEALKFQAFHDAVTSLPNRAHFHARVQELTSAPDPAPFALYLLDLDNFKEINDAFGHAHGDNVLRQLSSRLENRVSRATMVARLGGDEFALVVPTHDLSDARRFALQILRVFDSPFTVEDTELTLCGSVGAAVFPTHAANVEGLLRLADIAMYAAKRAGGARYFLDEPAGSRRSSRRPPLQAELRRALEGGELTLYYQPLVDLRWGTVSGVEALARWNHPHKGLVLPSQFIDLVEQDGLAGRLATWALRGALGQVTTWRARGLDVRVSVNLSARNLDNPDLPALVEGLLHECGAAPGWLTLELTENSIILDPGRTISLLSDLRALGVRIAVDDFGSGQSALAYLKRLPVDEVKIDRSFVLNMTVDRHDAAIVRSTIRLAHDLGLEVVGEGVENEATRNLLAAYGCDFGQGFFLGRPTTARSAALRLGMPGSPDQGEYSGTNNGKGRRETHVG